MIDTVPLKRSVRMHNCPSKRWCYSCANSKQNQGYCTSRMMAAPLCRTDNKSLQFQINLPSKITIKMDTAREWWTLWIFRFLIVSNRRFRANSPNHRDYDKRGPTAAAHNCIGTFRCGCRLNRLCRMEMKIFGLWQFKCKASAPNRIDSCSFGLRSHITASHNACPVPILN